MNEIAMPAAHSGTVAEALRAFTLLGGDWILWVLIVCSVLSVTVIIERIIYFARNRSPIRSFLEPLGDRLRGGDVAAAAALADVTRGAEARIAQTGLAHLDAGAESVEEIMASHRAIERIGFERYLMILGTMGNNAPFIGLFGTVLGIIKAFNDLATTPGQGGANVVMAGISEALVATAMGLLVAIPAVIAYNYFLKKLKEFSSNAESVERVILAYVKSANRSPLRAAKTAEA